MNRFLQVVTLVVLLHLLAPKESRAEDSLDFKLMYYQESDDRIRVVSPSFLYQADLSASLSVKIDGVYDAISGASPTGTPGLSSYNLPGLEVEDALNAVSGATPSATVSPSTAASASGSAATSSSGDVPMGTLQDSRYASNIEIIGKHGDHTPSGKFSISTEDDYDSVGVSAKDSVDFDKRNTTVTYGASYNHDNIQLLSGSEETKDVGDLLLGVARVLNERTSGKAIVTVGAESGFLNDQYKSVELNGLVTAENRPGDRMNMTFLLSLLRYVDAAKAGLETTYRYYSDDFGIDSHMVELVWNQELGKAVVVSPLIRYYYQSEADFYAVRFSGSPEFYTSDYRLSELVSTSYGLKVQWKVNDRLTTDLAYERYTEDGQDGETDDSAYPSADVISGGLKLWF